MGVLFYGGPHGAIEIEDRALAHLKLVVTTKLRRGESFTVSWEHPDEQTGAASTIWLHPSIPLRFVFDEVEPTALNARWLEQLASAAHTTGGIRLVPEHFEPSAAGEPEWSAHSSEDIQDAD